MKARAKIQAEAAKAAENATKATAKAVQKKEKKIEVAMEAEEEADEEAGSDSDADLVHESLKSPSERRARSNKGQASKYVPATESAADRDRRTLFVGNLSLEAAQGKSGTNALKRHLLSFAPSAKIESVRFRSVAFSAPTAGPADSGAAAGSEKEKAAEEESRRQAREKERVEQWKASQSGSTVGGRGNRRGDDEVVDKSKSYLDKSGKRKVAFIKKDVSGMLLMGRD